MKWLSRSGDAALAAVLTARNALVIGVVEKFGGKIERKKGSLYNELFEK